MIVVFRERFLWSLPQEAALEILMFFDWKTMRGHDYEIVIDGSQVGRSMKIEIDQTRSRGVWTSKIKRCSINRFPLRKTIVCYGTRNKGQL